MKYNVIINGCSRDAAKQIRRLNGFALASGLDLSEGNTIIIRDGICDEDDKEQLAEMVPTKSVLFVYLDFYDPEAIVDYLSTVGDREGLYLFTDSYSGQELAIRLGTRLQGSCLADVQELTREGEQFLARKMVYSNHMIGTYELGKMPCCISFAKGQDELNSAYEGPRHIQEVNLCSREKENPICSMEYPKESSGLETSPLVVAVGRGSKNKANVERMEKTAERMDAAFGVSRPVAMNAWAPMDALIGVSGSMIKPEICIAAGASGAPAFYAGIEKSKFIVAVNTDENASIMKKADVAVVGDCNEVLDALAERINREKGLSE